MLSKSSDRNELFCTNVISTLNLIGQTFPHSGIDSDICMSVNSKITASKLKSAFQSMLIAFLSKRLTENMTKKILMGFENYYLMLESPPIMADYITRCYDSDNLSISILALHSLFKLITGTNSPSQKLTSLTLHIKSQRIPLRIVPLKFHYFFRLQLRISRVLSKIIQNLDR